MLITSSMVLGKRRLQPILFFGGVRIAGAFLISDCGLLVIILRAFSRDLPCCGDRTHCKKRLGIFATFLRLGALLGSFRLEICHFCCVFVPRFAIGELATIANRKKLQFGPIFLFLGSWEGPRDSAGMLWARCGTGGLNLIRCWVVVDPMRSGVDLARGGVDSMQRQGIAQPRRLGACSCIVSCYCFLLK